MERRGSGFKKILDAYKWESEKRSREFSPVMESDDSSFFVTLPNLNYGETINGVPSSSESTEDNLSTLYPSATQNELAKYTGLTVRGVEWNYVMA